MEIKSINQLYNHYYNNQSLQPVCKKQQLSGNSELPRCYYYPLNINFKAANSKHIKTLFSYGLPCIYTGIEMIDPTLVQKMIKQNIHKLPAKELCKYMDVFYDSLLSNEKEVYELIRAQAEIQPKKNIKEVLQSLKTQYEHELLEKQIPIFTTLKAYSYSLPEDLQLQIDLLLAESMDKINNKPVISIFSVTEFKYKLEKVKCDVAKLHDKKSLAIINNIIKLSQKLEPKTTEKNINNQRKIVSDIKTVLNCSVLQDNTALQDLITTSSAQLNEEKILVPFSRKSFLYDLSQILKDIDDSSLKAAFMKIAEKLPTSKSSNAAYITKFSKESCEKIFYRLLWPSLATVEHILPKSCSGADCMANYAGACARENSDRSSISFVEQLKRKPDTAKYCQKYLNRLIKYVKRGIFEKENISIKYIENFKNTIETESQGQIVLDISALYKEGRYREPQSASDIEQNLLA